MKALRLKSPGGLDHIVMDEVPDPGQPGPGEVRVTIQANSLNYHDFLVAAGMIRTADGRVLLSDGAGVVEEVGQGVTEFQPGDHVVSTFFPIWGSGRPTADTGGFRHTPGDGVDGMAAEHVVRPVAAFTHAPQGWSHIAAATIPTSALTAWRALVVDGRLKAGDTVLIQGTGGVSICALQIAKAMGARVIVTSSSDEKLARVRQLGADYTINYRQEPKWGQRALELTHRVGVDYVVDVGGPATLDQSLAALRVGGQVSLVGVLSGLEGKFFLFGAIAKQATIRGLLVGSRQDQVDFVRALEVIPIDPMVDQVYPAAELRTAFEHLKSGRHFGKICLEW